MGADGDLARRRRRRRRRPSEAPAAGRRRCLCRAGRWAREFAKGNSPRERAEFWIGVSCLFLGVVLGLFWPQLLALIVHSELRLTPRSTSFGVWRSTPVPLRIDFYFWNWTNPHEIGDPRTVPHFAQMGPYRFKETKEKVNITWNENNGTISFRQLRRWYFDAENSNGTLSDNVTTVNVVGLTAAHVVRDWSYLMQRSVSLALRSTKQDIAITRTTGQFLFEGYEDPLITIASTVPALAGVDIPNFDKFGWFYKRNGSVDYDGHFNMDTGSEDIAHLGELSRWNYNNFTPFYEGRCGELRGSAGELWPPGRTEADTVQLFAPDLCRSVSLDFAGRMEEAGIAGLRFEGGPLMLDNGQLDAENTCFCDGACVAGGVANVSACRYGAPAFVSFPHFHLADPAYRAAVAGMRPSADEHAFYIAMEPTFGIPLDVAARFQINLLLQRNQEITMLSRVPEQLMFPVIWFEQRAAITPELATPLKLLLHLPTALLAAAGVLVLGGLACIGVPRLARRRRGQQGVRQGPLAASFVVKETTSNGHHHHIVGPPLTSDDDAGGRNRTRSLAAGVPPVAGVTSGDAVEPLLARKGGVSPASTAASSGLSSPVQDTAAAPFRPESPDHEEGSPEAGKQPNVPCHRLAEQFVEGQEDPHP